MSDDSPEEAEQEEKKPEVNQRAVLGAILGFPLGYVTGQSTLASSGDDDPSTSAMAHGLAGAAAGYLVAEKWEGEEQKLQNSEINDSNGKKRELLNVDPEGAQSDAKLGAMAGLVAGAFGTTFSGSSGGSDDNLGGGGGGGGAGAGVKTQGPSAMSAKIPILHSIIAGGIAGAAVGAMRSTLEDFGKRMKDAKAKHLEAKQREEDEAKKREVKQDGV